MNINLTLIGQAIAFALFVAFCMKKIWPPLMHALEERQRKIADGLNATEKAKLELAEARAQVKAELEEAKVKAAQLIEQANRRANQIVESSRAQAAVESERLYQQAREVIDNEICQARERLKIQVAELAVEGASKILRERVDMQTHSTMLNRLVADL